MAALDRAIAIALEAHAEQVDKLGDAYILHPLRVMMQMNTDEGRIVAVLHDVLEDCPEMTLLEMFERGIPRALLDAVDILTRRKGEDYRTFIERCAAAPIARSVKIADIRDNLDPARFSMLEMSTQTRLDAKYLPALARLLYGAWPVDPKEGR